MQRPQPLQNCGSRKGLGLSTVVGMLCDPFPALKACKLLATFFWAMNQQHSRHERRGVRKICAGWQGERQKWCAR